MYKTCSPVMYQLRVCTAGASFFHELVKFSQQEFLATIYLHVTDEMTDIMVGKTATQNVVYRQVLQS